MGCGDPTIPCHGGRRRILEISKKTVPLGPGKAALLFSLSGALDAETTAKLDAVLKDVLAQPSPVTLLRFADVHYVNSSGMGLLIKYSDLHHTRGGELALVEVSPKVLSLFRMLGLLSVLKNFNTQAQAIAALGTAKPGPETPAHDDGSVLHLPFTTACKGCETRLVMTKAGFYKCPVCDTCYQVEIGRPLRAFHSELRIPFEASLSYDPGCVEGVCVLAGRVAEGAGLPRDERESLVKAFRELLEHLVQRGREGKGRTLRILIASDPGDLMIGIRTDVKIPDAGQDAAAKALEACVDRFETIDATAGSFFKIWKKGPAPVQLARA